MIIHNLGFLQGSFVEWDVTGFSYESKSFSISSQDTVGTGVFFKTDGSIMYAMGTSSDTVYQYTLSTPWDVSTASYASKSFSVNSEESLPSSVFFRNDGSTMYVVGTSSDTVYQYTLSTPWDVSTASYASKSFSVITQENIPEGLFFRANGSIMYIVGHQNDTVYQYTLSTPWDVSTASYASKSFSVSSQDSSPASISFNPSGLEMVVLGGGSDTVYQYALSTPWDVSTASYASKSFSVNSEESSPREVFIKPDGTKMYVIGNANDTVYQYTT